MVRRNFVSLFLVAMSVVAVSQAASPKRLIRSIVPTNKMNEVYTDLLLVKVNGADHQDGTHARVTPEQAQRISEQLQGARYLGGLSHGGWTEWELPSIMDPRAAARQLRN